MPAPANLEKLRNRLKLHATSWALTKLGLPTRAELAGLTKETWLEHVEYVLGDKAAVSEVKTGDGHIVYKLSWLIVLDMYYQLRKKAMEICKEVGIPIAEGLRRARLDSELRQKHVLTPTALASGAEAARLEAGIYSSSSHSGGAPS